jgi:hypothetical protein
LIYIDTGVHYSDGEELKIVQDKGKVADLESKMEHHIWV